MMTRITLLALLAIALQPLATIACLTCPTEQSTLTEELETADVVVMAKLIRPAPEDDDQSGEVIDPDTGKAIFEVTEVLVGEESIEPGTRVAAIYYGDPDKQATYLLRGIDQPLDWRIPLTLSEKAVAYIKQLRKLPESGPERMRFFLDYVQHEDPMLAQDAYDEFARAPYSDVKQLEDQMDRAKLLEWLEDPMVSPNRKRLFYTMLGVCGKQEDIAWIRAMILSDSRELVPTAGAMTSASFLVGGPFASAITIETIRLDERRRKLGLDALIACYLTLEGPGGLDLIDERFFSTKEINGKQADYSHVYSALMALRVLADEGGIVPLERVKQSARLLLGHEDFADSVIVDLARWEDWEVLEQLTEMYSDAGVEGSGVQKYVREPIITYLDLAAKQEGDIGQQATKALGSIESIDPEAVRRARSLRAFGFIAAAQARKAEPPKQQPPEPVGLEALGNGPLEFDTVEVSDSPPDPASFGQEDTTKPQPDGIAAAEPQAGQEEAPGANTEPSPEKPEKNGRQVAAVEPAPEPPSRLLLIAAPTVAGVLCFGLFWMILRSGGA